MAVTGRIDLQENVTKAARQIADALRNVTKTAQTADKALDDAFEQGDRVRRGGGGGGDGRGDESGGLRGIADSITQETKRSTQAINDLEKTRNDFVKAGTREAAKYTRDIQKQFETENSIFDRRGQAYNKLQQELSRIRQQDVADGQKAGAANIAREQRDIQRRTALFKGLFRDRGAAQKEYNRTAAQLGKENIARENQEIAQRTASFKKLFNERFAAQDRDNQALKDSTTFRRTQIKQQVADERRLAKEINSARRQIEVGLLELFFTLHSLNKPITQITEFLERFTLSNIRAYTEVEKFSSTLKIVTGDASVAERDLKRLLDITVELAAIDTPGLIQFSARLQTAGLTARQAEKGLIAVTKRMEEQGKSASSTNRVLEQIVQAVNANIISMQDFRPILREYPRLFQDFSQALGVTITDLDSLRNAADSVGGPTQAIIRLFEHVSEVAQGADINTINKQLDEFKDRVFVLRSALGEALQPQVLALIRLGNSFVDWLANANETMRILIGLMAAFGAVTGKVASGGINILIALIAKFQLDAAINQVRVMSESLNVMAQSAGIAGKGITEATEIATRSANSIRKWGRRLLVATGIVASLGVAITAFIVVQNLFTKQTRLARKEYDNFIKTILRIPNSISEGNVSIKRQIEELKEFRLELLKTRDEFEKGQSGAERRGELTEASFRTSQILAGNAEPINAAEKRFIELNKQIQATDANIADLNIVLLETEEGLDALRRIMIRTQTELDKAITEEDADKTRRLQASIDSLVASFRLLYRQLNTTNRTIRGTAEELIELDFVIRRLERQQKELSDLPDNLIDFDTSGIQQNARDLTKSLEREAELKKRLLELEEDDEAKKNLEIKKINEQLRFDKENIAKETAKQIANIEAEGVKQRLQQELELAQRLEDLREEERKNRVDLREKQRKLREDEQKERLAGELKVAEGIEAIRIKEFENRLKRRKQQEELDKQRLADELAFAEAIEALRIREFERRIEQRNKDRENAKRRAAEELKELQENEKARRLLVESGPAATEARDTAQRNRERLKEVLDLSTLIQREAEKNQREVARLAQSFGRGLARSITDFIYEGEVGFAEFLKNFAKTSTRIILQAKINAFIQKRISDDLTRHQIINIQKVAAAQVAAGTNAQNITSAGVSGLASGLGLSSAGIGTFALAGLVIAPFLVRAIKDGFSDTKVELDGREVGKTQSRSNSRLAREGRIRI